MPVRLHGGKGSRMLVRRNVFRIVTIGSIVAMALWSAPLALAHEGENHEHDAPPAAGGGAAETGGLPPVVEGGGGGGDVAGGGGGGAPAGDPNAPAPGAQPAAPGAPGELPRVDGGDANPADVAADAAGVDPNAAVEEVEVGADEVVAPIEVDASPEVAVPTASPAPVAAPVVVDGGGTDGAAAGAGAANVAGPPLATPTGALPFTGLAENLLLVALAGILVPIGVLLYCAARRGELRFLHRQLAMPRFQWADPRQRPFHLTPRSDEHPQLRWPGT